MRFSITALLSACVLAAISTGAQAQGIFHWEYSNDRHAHWNHQDVRLDRQVDGRSESGAIPFINPQAKLFVRDRDVQTSRGLLDRVCLDSRQHGERPTLVGLSPVGEPPDGQVELRQVGIHCVLLPRADAYRVWKRAPRAEQRTPDNWRRWSTPAVFQTLESMRDQDDHAAIERNIRRIIDSLDLQGVCARITVHHASADAQGSWVESQWLTPMFVQEALIWNAYRQQGRDLSRLAAADGQHLQPRDGYIRNILLNVRNEPLTYNAAVLRTISGVASREMIEGYWAAAPMDDRRLGSTVRVQDCFGDPVTIRTNQGARQPHYVLEHLHVFLPRWNQYVESQGSARDAWEARTHYLALHELIHMHDHLRSLNEIAFQQDGRFNMGNHRAGLENLPGGYSGAALEYGLDWMGFSGYHLSNSYARGSSGPTITGNPLYHLHEALDPPAPNLGFTVDDAQTSPWASESERLQLIDEYRRVEAEHARFVEEFNRTGELRVPAN